MSLVELLYGQIVIYFVRTKVDMVIILTQLLGESETEISAIHDLDPPFVL